MSPCGEYATSKEIETGYISGITFKPKKITYAVIDGLAIFEGDIVLGTVDEIRRFTKDVETQGQSTKDIQTAVARPVGTGSRWPNALVPYEVDPNLPELQRIGHAIADIEAKTPVRLFRRPAGPRRHDYPNYVYFTTSPQHCWSRVGMQGTGRQLIELANDCTTGSVIHEIGHALGLWHEQSREDRDTFVRFHPQNMLPNTSQFFDPHINDGDDVGEYDYCSIMHYPRDAFTSNGQDTIEVLRPELLEPGVPCNNMIGQRYGLSKGDTAAIAQLYLPLIIAYRGSDQGGIWYTKYHDQSGWGSLVQVPGVASSIGPQLIVGGGIPSGISRYFMAWKGQGNDQGIFYNTYTEHGAQAGWTPQQQVPGVESSTGPALTTHHGRVVMAWKGKEGDHGIFYSSAPFTSPTVWSPQEQVPNVASSIGPQLTLYNRGETLLMAWKGIEGDQGIFYNTYTYPAGWTPPRKVPNVGSSTGPALTTHHGRVFMAWKGIEGDYRIFYNTYTDQAGWTPQQQVPNAIANSMPSLSAYVGRVYMCWVGLRFFRSQPTLPAPIYFAYYSNTDGWSAPQEIRGTMATMAFARPGLAEFY
jgi:Astacin (Peptidase family M12A)